MPDISLCLNSDCSRATYCYRYCTRPSTRQSYINPLKEDGSCDYFIEVKKILLNTDLLPKFNELVEEEKNE